MNTETSQELLSIPVVKIVPNRNQPRTEFDQTELEKLAKSIGENGLIQPITVRLVTDVDEEEHYELIAGERRWRAVSTLLEWDYIDAIVKLNSDALKSATQALVENLDREDLNPIEEATAFRHLMDLNSWGQKELAHSLGKSRAAIANSLRILKLDDSIKEDVKKGLLDKSAAITLAGVKDNASQKALAIKCIKKGWNFKDLKKEAKKITNPDAPKKEAKEGKNPAKPAIPDIDTSCMLLVNFDTIEHRNVLMAMLSEVEKWGEDTSFVEGDKIIKFLKG